jgi:hypothetical protein
VASGAAIGTCTIPPNPVLGFHSQVVGTTSSSHQVTLTDSGNAALTIGSVGLTATNAVDFAQTNMVSRPPRNPGAGCQLHHQRRIQPDEYWNAEWDT